MWTVGADPINVNAGFYTVTKIAPNGNAALKIACSKSQLSDHNKTKEYLQ
jgi:hypothetical protein